MNKDEIFPRPKIYFKINNACNMRCSYCFQQTEKSSEKKVDFRHYSILFGCRQDLCAKLFAGSG